MELKNSHSYQNILDEIIDLSLSSVPPKNNLKRKHKYFDFDIQKGIEISDEEEKEIKNKVWGELTIKDLTTPHSQLIQEATSILQELTDFEKIQFYPDHNNCLEQIGITAQENFPNKHIVYVGKQTTKVSPNYLYIPQLCEVKSNIKQHHSRIAFLIVDPLYYIQRSNYFEQHFNELKELCSGYGIFFILDERITAGRIHTKGINYVFQFKADAIITGINYSNGKPLAAIAYSPRFFVEFLPGAKAPNAISLLHLKYLFPYLKNNSSSHHLNELANQLCVYVNKKSSHSIGIEVMNNFGNILWVQRSYARCLQSKLLHDNIRISNEQFFYIHEGITKKDFPEITERILANLKNLPHQISSVGQDIETT